MTEFKIALVGNKNCGKSALFNKLTGEKAHVGNYPGVTTHVQSSPLRVGSGEKSRRHSKHTVPDILLPVVRSEAWRRAKGISPDDHEGIYHEFECNIVDMPGLSSINAFGPEEQDAIDEIMHGNVDLIIDVVDASRIEMGLYLAIQLMELGIPQVIAISMMDEAAKEGRFIDVANIEAALGIPVVPVSSAKSQGITELLESCAAAYVSQSSKPRHAKLDFCSGMLHKAIHSICHIIEFPARDKGIPIRFAAEKLIERDPLIAEALDIQEPEDLDVIEHIVEHLEADTGMTGDVVLAKERYAFVDGLCEQYVTIDESSADDRRWSDRIDRVMTHKVFGIPIFLAIMTVVFWLTFVAVGGPLQSLLEEAFDIAGNAVGNWMLGAGVSHWLYDLVINGAWAGVCSVLSFLPIILVMFFLLSILEDSGYTTRVAFVMDKLLRKIGLSGRSLAPLIIGFGCNVPAIMSARSLPSERDRKLTIALIPFMSCSAKLPVYSMITAAFFGPKAGLAMISMYAIGIVVAVIVSVVLGRTHYKGDAMMYIMELPDYRIPPIRNVLRHMWDNAKEFVRKAFTIIFIGTIVIWFLQNFDLSFSPVSDSAQSILAIIGTKISFIFAPIGLDSWQAATALLAGLVAKEAVVSTLAVLTSVGAGSAVAIALGQIFTPLTAFVFLVFILLYVPCIATFATVRNELNSTGAAVHMVVRQLVVAYAVCFIIYHIGLMLGFV